MIGVLCGVAVAAALLGWYLTGRVRRYALSRSVLDVPNARSSHRTPTPRGGGLAIVIVVLAGLMVGAAGRWIPFDTAAALAGGGAVVALAGWIDDHQGLTAHTRALLHFAAAGWVLVWAGGMPVARYGDTLVSLGPFGALLAGLGIVWAINFYNFMDGIDGLAGGEAVCVGLVAGVLLYLAGQPGLALTAVLTAAAAGGFLAWNWAPARIFLGDVGSGFLGFMFGALALLSERKDALPVLGWLLLLGVFVFDATVTLGRRVLRGERWYAAHRSHAYQRAAARWGHARTTVGALLLTLTLGGAAVAAIMAPQRITALLIGAGAALTLVYLGVERASPGRPRAAEREHHPDSASLT